MEVIISAILGAIGTIPIFAGILWLARNLIVTRLTRSVGHEFDSKLETLRTELRQKEELLKADLRSKESEIAALRSGALTAASSRQIALDQRRLEAVDQLWSAFIALAPARLLSGMMVHFYFEKCAKEAPNNPKLRSMFQSMLETTGAEKIDAVNAEKARPFVTPSVWSAFVAYRTLVGRAVVMAQILKMGMDAKFLEREKMPQLLKAALPHQANFIETQGEAGYFLLAEDLEALLLTEIETMLAGREVDAARIQQTAEITRLAAQMAADEAQQDAKKSIT